MPMVETSRRKLFSLQQNNLSSNENNIQSLLLIYTGEHPKVKQAYELQQSLEHQLKHLVDEVIERKAFELSNIKSFIETSKKNLEKATIFLNLL